MNTLSYLLITVLSVIFVLSAGCVQHEPAPMIRYYSLLNNNHTDHTTQDNTTGANNLNNQSIIQLLPISVRSEFAGQAFVYQTGKNQYQQDHYHLFISAPNIQATQLLQQIMSNNNNKLNALLIGPDSLVIANYALQITIDQLYIDTYHGAQASAKTNITAQLYKITEGKANVIAKQQFYATKMLNNSKNYDLIIQAYNTNFNAITEQLSQFINNQINKQ